MVYDLIVVGNGLAAQTFLFELFQTENVNKSQNFSVAQIYDESIAPSCSLRTTATVSLSGIEEGVSELGDELRSSFFLFEEFIKNHHPKGVEKVKQLITFSNDDEKEKILRRYKQISLLKADFLKEAKMGVELDSYIIDPYEFNYWFTDKLSKKPIKHFKAFIKNILINNSGIIDCELINGNTISGKKIVLGTGGFAKLFSGISSFTSDYNKTQIVAGSFLTRQIDLNIPSFYMTVDGHNFIYRSHDKKLILGSASNDNRSGVVIADLKTLKDIVLLFNEISHLSVGDYKDFSVVTGIRHKASKRRAIAKALDLEKKVFMINGFYKNGFSYSHFCAKKIVGEINLP